MALSKFYLLFNLVTWLFDLWPRKNYRHGHTTWIHIWVKFGGDVSKTVSCIEVVTDTQTVRRKHLPKLKNLTSNVLHSKINYAKLSNLMPCRLCIELVKRAKTHLTMHSIPEETHVIKMPPLHSSHALHDVSTISKNAGVHRSYSDLNWSAKIRVFYALFRL